MRKLGKNEALCIKCRTCEDACSNLYFKEKNREKSAIRVNESDGKAVIAVCTQCGACAEVCPVQAITADKNGVYRIDKKLCVGCLACVGFCPEASMFHYLGDNEPYKCVACGVCARQCPVQAIFVEECQKGAE